MAVLSGTSGFFGGAGFSYTVTLLVVGGAYTASLALVNGCTRGSSSSSTSSSAAGGGGGHRAAGTGSGAGARAGVGLLAGVGVSVGGLGSRALWAWVQTPGAGSWARKVNSSFSRDRIHSSEESWRTPTVRLGDMSSKSTSAVVVMYLGCDKDQWR